MVWDLVRSRSAWALLGVVALAGLAILGAAGFFAHAARPRAELIIGNGTEPESLDPAQASGTPEGRLARALFEPLVILAPGTLDILPGAAARWEVSPDGRRYTFHLHADGRWSDGMPLEAEDFAWSLRRVLSPETGARYASNLFDIRGARAYARPAPGAPAPAAESVGIRALDPLTLEIELDRAAPSFLSLLSMPAFSPVPRAVIERHGARWTRPGNLVSNGPFRLVERRLRERLRLERNPHYWNQAAVGIGTIDVLTSDSVTTLLNLYFTGDADWVTDVPASLVATLRRDRPRDLRTAPILGTYFYRINTTHPVLRDRRIRAALDLALDKETLVRAVHHGGELPAWTLVPPTMPQWTPPERPKFDRAAARELLARALAERGLATLPPFELLYNTSELHQSIAELVQMQWREALGVTCRLARQDWSAARASIRRLDYSVSRGVWIGDYLDPLNFLDIFTTSAGNNQTGFSDARYDAIVNRLARESTDPQARATLLREAESILLDAAPIIPIYHYVSYNLVRPDLRGFEDNLLDVHFPQFLRSTPESPR